MGAEGRYFNNQFDPHGWLADDYIQQQKQKEHADMMKYAGGYDPSVMPGYQAPVAPLRGGTLGSTFGSQTPVYVPKTGGHYEDGFFVSDTAAGRGGRGFMGALDAGKLPGSGHAEVGLNPDIIRQGMINQEIQAGAGVKPGQQRAMNAVESARAAGQVPPGPRGIGGSIVTEPYRRG
jgi:hypothetical protein